jgi:hypothetical protein
VSVSGHTQHAKYSPSSAFRWMVCYGSARLSETAPDVRSPYAEDGVEAHSILAYALQNGYRDAKVAFDAMKAAGAVFTYRTDDEDVRIDSVQFGLDEIWTIFDTWGDPAQLPQWGVEARVRFPSNLYYGQVWGTADVWIYIPSFNFLYVIDFKHGAGVAVEAEGNTQTFIYATAVLDELGATGISPDYVVPTIIQPRAFHPDGRIRRDVVSAAWLREVFVPKVDDAITECEKPDAPLLPGVKQCRFCPGFTICPAREAMALKVANENFTQISDVDRSKLPDVRSLPIERFTYVLPMLDMLKDWINEFETAAKSFAMSGGHIPGQKLVEVYAKRVWFGDMEKHAEFIASLTGKPIDEIYPRRLTTITRAETMLKEVFKRDAPRGQKKRATEMAKYALSHMVQREGSGNLTLVPESDPRPAINKAMINFGQVNVPALPPPIGDETE